MFRQLEDKVWVAGQIGVEDFADVRSLGIDTVVNNRPDGEEAEQPTSAEIEAAARAAGLRYRHIPVSSGFSRQQVEDMSSALASSEGGTLAFCKSGTRSTFLWALARATQGEDADSLASKAASAGYDLSPIRGFLQR